MNYEPVTTFVGFTASVTSNGGGAGQSARKSQKAPKSAPATPREQRPLVIQVPASSMKKKEVERQLNKVRVDPTARQVIETLEPMYRLLDEHLERQRRTVEQQTEFQSDLTDEMARLTRSMQELRRTVDDLRKTVDRIDKEAKLSEARMHASASAAPALSVEGSPLKSPRERSGSMIIRRPRKSSAPPAEPQKPTESNPPSPRSVFAAMGRQASRSSLKVRHSKKNGAAKTSQSNSLSSESSEAAD